MISIKIETFLEKRDGDGSKCIVCKEPIFYKMYVGIVQMADNKTELKEIKLCESCAYASEIKIKQWLML